ncbi:MAG: DNA repair protein RadC [Endomicrobiales bacterium]|nr:DNA repair protein RadC [Endomicrobiales bacterium]
MPASKKPAPHYFGHRKRLKERFLRSGLNAFADYEVLELALTFAVPQKDTKPAAKELLKKFGSFAAVLEAGVGELKTVTGVKDQAAALLKFLRETSWYYARAASAKKDLLSSPSFAADYLRSFLKGSRDEVFCALFLNSKNNLMKAESIQTGTVDRSVVYPRKIVERALLNNCCGVIIAHNHPAGSTDPSKDDISTTSSVKEALDTVDIKLLDHIIIGGNGYFSFKENNLI